MLHIRLDPGSTSRCCQMSCVCLQQQVELLPSLEQCSYVCWTLSRFGPFRNWQLGSRKALGHLLHEPKPIIWETKTSVRVLSGLAVERDVVDDRCLQNGVNIQWQESWYFSTQVVRQACSSKLAWLRKKVRHERNFMRTTVAVVGTMIVESK